MSVTIEKEIDLHHSPINREQSPEIAELMIEVVEYYRDQAIFDNVAFTGNGPFVITSVFEEMVKIGLDLEELEIPVRVGKKNLSSIKSSGVYSST